MSGADEASIDSQSWITSEFLGEVEKNGVIYERYVIHQVVKPQELAH